MARFNDVFEPEDYDTTSVTSAQPSHRASRRGSPSPSPTASFSDKENATTVRNQAHSKEKSISMGPPQKPTPNTDRSNKKRKLADRDVNNAPNATQVTHRQQLDDAADSRYYDPDQSMEERRAVRKEYRDLSRDLTDSRGEYLEAGSDGLIKTLQKQNELYGNVKQTSDATLDSRLLVSTADLSAKRTTQLNVGDSTTGIDVDDFVTKCINFMRRAAGDGTSTQRQRQQRQSSEDVDDQAFDEGDAFDWEYLGRNACYQYTIRPPAPGFLLGPLSVQKRARKATQRRERLGRRDPNEATRPEELKAQDLERTENSNLTTLCRNIRALLVQSMQEKRDAAEAECTEDVTDEEMTDLLDKHSIGDDSGMLFFNFVINPKSFGQSVENLFYVSFLIRDGLVGIGSDSRRLPTLHPTDAQGGNEGRAENVQKRQAVFHLDFDTWEELIRTFNIKESIIPHRKPDPSAQVSSTGWYG